MTVSVWNAASRSLERSFKLDIGGSAAFSPDADTLVIAVKNSVKAYSIETGTLVAELTGDFNYAMSVAVSTDGNVFAAGTDQGARVWKADGTQLHHLKRKHKDFQKTGRTSVSPDGSKVLTELDKLEVYDAATGKPGWKVRGEQNLARHVWSPDSKLVLVQLSINRSRIVDVGTGKTIQKLAGSIPLAFSADGKHVATSASPYGEERTVYVFELGNKKPIRTIKGHRGPVDAAAFAPDGTTLATASRDGTLLIWPVP